MLKTAICLSGKLGYLENHKNIFENVIAPYQADVFIDTWIPYKSVENTNESFLDETDIKGFIELYRPKLINMEYFDLMPLIHQIRSNIPDNSTAINGYPSPNTNKENVMFMWYKIWKCNQLRKLYEKINRIRYDTVIRLRFDVEFERFPVIEPERKTVYIPMGGDYEGGICDQVALGDATTMDIYCELWNEIYRYSSGGIGIHPESILRRHIQINQLRIVRFPTGLKLRGVTQ